MQRPLSPATLVLGAGGGILSLGASLFSDVVVATELNQRAVACFIAQKQTLMPIQAEDRQQRGQSPKG
jgi:predicted RNA methylase